MVRSFLDGLLPEGEARQAVANDFAVLRDDTYGLIRALGGDCAGALVIQAADEPAPPLPTTLTAERLSAAEIGDLVANLRSAPARGRRAARDGTDGLPADIPAVVDSQLTQLRSAFSAVSV